MTHRVRHLTFSRSGGAGVVATRLSQAISQEGWDSEVIASTDSDLRSRPLEHPAHTIAAAIDNYVLKSPGWPSLVSVSRDALSTHNDGIPDADIVHLHWVNGVFPLARAPFSNTTPVVWTLHDMNPMTGACHHSFSCRQFETDCSGCPAVRGAFRGKVRSHLKEKTDAISGWEQLTLVSPSRWLAQQAQRSSIFEGREMVVIPNPLDGGFFSKPMPPRSPSRQKTDCSFVVVAADLDDPIKDVACAVDAFIASRSKNPDSRLVLVGRGGSRFLGIAGVTRTGALSPEEIIALLDKSDAIIIPSQAENSPSVAYEAASRGLMPIVRRAGGLPEVVENLKTGYTFDTREDLIDRLSTFATHSISPAQRNKIATMTKELCDPRVVAKKYIELYEKAR